MTPPCDRPVTYRAAGSSYRAASAPLLHLLHKPVICTLSALSASIAMLIRVRLQTPANDTLAADYKTLQWMV
jgi:hypothetical protein